MKKTDNEKEKVKQTVREVFSNNYFLLKLMFTASPAFVIFVGLDAIRNQVSIFFEHTVLIGYVIEVVVIDENTNIRTFKNELRWNEVAFR